MKSELHQKEMQKATERENGLKLQIKELHENMEALELQVNANKLLHSMDKGKEFTVLEQGSEIEACDSFTGGWRRGFVVKIMQFTGEGNFHEPTYDVQYLDGDVEKGVLASRIRSVGGNTLVQHVETKKETIIALELKVASLETENNLLESQALEHGKELSEVKRALQDHKNEVKVAAAGVRASTANTEAPKDSDTEDTLGLKATIVQLEAQLKEETQQTKLLLDENAELVRLKSLEIEDKQAELTRTKDAAKTLVEDVTKRCDNTEAALIDSRKEQEEIQSKSKLLQEKLAVQEIEHQKVLSNIESYFRMSGIDPNSLLLMHGKVESSKGVDASENRNSSSECAPGSNSRSDSSDMLSQLGGVDVQKDVPGPPSHTGEFPSLSKKKLLRPLHTIIILISALTYVPPWFIYMYCRFTKLAFPQGRHNSGWPNPLNGHKIC